MWQLWTAILKDRLGLGTTTARIGLQYVRSKCDIREFTKPRRRRRGQHRVKNEFIFYLRISRYSKVIYFVYHCQSYLKTQCETQR